MDYGESPGNPTPLVEDARPTIRQVSFHLWFSFAADHHFSNYRFWLAAGFLSKIHLIRSVVKGLERKLANYLLLLLIRKQCLRAPRCLFLKVGIIIVCLHSLGTFPHLQFIINYIQTLHCKVPCLHQLPVCLIQYVFPLLLFYFAASSLTPCYHVLHI